MYVFAKSFVRTMLHKLQSSVSAVVSKVTVLKHSGPIDSTDSNAVIEICTTEEGSSKKCCRTNVWANFPSVGPFESDLLGERGRGSILLGGNSRIYFQIILSFLLDWASPRIHLFSFPYVGSEERHPRRRPERLHTIRLVRIL